MRVRKLDKAGAIAVWMLVAGLAGCAAGPRVELSENAASRIRTIALLDIAEPTVDQVLHRGSSNESHSSTYAQMLTNAQVEFSPLLAEAITRQLERSNYQVLELPTQRPVIRGNGQVDVSAVDTDADAILVVRFKGAGYSSSSTSALQPWAIVEAQLFDTHTRKPLYRRIFNGGDNFDIDGAAHLATNARYQYDSPVQLEAKLDDSVDGIKDAELAIAAAIGQEFAIGTRPIAGYDQAARPAAVAPEKTAAERDREAAAALAAQWAAAAPPPAPAAVPAAAVEPAPATTADNASTAAEQAAAPNANPNPNLTPATEAQAAAAEPDVVAPEPPAIDSAIATDAPPSPPPAAAATEAVAAEPMASIPAPPPPAISAVASTDTEPARADPTPAAISAPIAQAPIAELRPAAPIAPAPSANSAPVLILKQRTPVRVSPTARAKVFASLPAGTSFTRSGRVIHNGSGSWCFVKAGAVSGWVPIDAVQR